jgi:hypothetical protein
MLNQVFAGSKSEPEKEAYRWCLTTLAQQVEPDGPFADSAQNNSICSKSPIPGTTGLGW